MKKALLVIDYINGIVRDGSCSEWAKSHPILSNVNSIISQARKADIPIYFVRLAFDEQYSQLPKHSKIFNYIKQHGLFQLGSESTKFVAELDYQVTKDIVINKTGASPFAGNDLQEQLEALGIEHLIFTGVATDNAISAGVRYAHDQGFFTTIVEDTCGAANEDLHKPILNALAKVTNEIINTEACIETVLKCENKTGRES